MTPRLPPLAFALLPPVLSPITIQACVSSHSGSTVINIVLRFRRRGARKTGE